MTGMNIFFMVVGFCIVTAILNRIGSKEPKALTKKELKKFNAWKEYLDKAESEDQS